MLYIAVSKSRLTFLYPAHDQEFDPVSNLRFRYVWFWHHFLNYYYYKVNTKQSFILLMQSVFKTYSVVTTGEAIRCKSHLMKEIWCSLKIKNLSSLLKVALSVFYVLNANQLYFSRDSSTVPKYFTLLYFFSENYIVKETPFISIYSFHSFYDPLYVL